MSAGAAGMSYDAAITVRACAPADEPAVLELLQAAFGRWPRGVEGVRPEQFFRWKHSESPFGRSALLVAEADGAAVGFLALMPWRLRFGEHVHTTTRGVDLVVDPAAQRRGISMRLIAAARKGYDSEIVMGWSNPNERSRVGVLKSGRRRVDGIPRFVGAGAVTWAGVKRLALHGGVEPAHAGRAAHDAAAVLADESMLRAVLGRAGAGPDRIETARSTEFLRWRYGRPGAYRALVAEDRDGRPALAIFQTQRRGLLRTAHVVELLVARDDVKLARRLTRGVRRAANADFVACAFASPRTALHCGFVPAPGAAMIAANPLRDGLQPDPTLPGSWALSLGDLELI
jgi:predicted N-acetyltransferase YhbS